MTTKVLICGGRYGVRPRWIAIVLDQLREQVWQGEEIEVVEGDAPGTDRISGCWASMNGMQDHKVPVSNQLDGADQFTAPKRRNSRMLEEHPDIKVCLGFPGHGGSNDMLNKAQKAGKTIWDVEFDDDAFRVWQWPDASGDKKLICEGIYR